MGRNARLKKQRREEERRKINEAWGFFTSRGFLNQVRKMILDSGASVNSCICCTKVFVQLANTVGLNAIPLTVEASVFNPVFADWIEVNGLDPSDEDMVRMGEKGGRFVVLGARDERQPKDSNSWPGHLVAVISAKGKPTTVIDLTIDQANRPKKDILIRDPLVFGVPDNFTDGGVVATGFMGTKAGKIAFVYRAFPEDTSYEVSPDWQRDYAAKTHDKIEIEEPKQEPSGLLGPDGRLLEPAGE